MKSICMTLAALTLGSASLWAAKKADPPLNDAGLMLETNYSATLEQLRTELAAKLPDPAKTDQVNAFLASDALDAKLAQFVVLNEATPEGLAKFAQQGNEQAALVERILADA